MSEKSEKPTTKKLADARKKGQVAKSAEITSGVQLAAMLGYFFFEGTYLLQAFETLVELSIALLNDDFTTSIGRWLDVLCAILIRFMLGISGIVILTTIVTVIAQIGPMFATEALRPSLDKINPLANLKQIVSLKTLFEFSKSLFKVGTLSVIFFYLIRQYAPALQFLPLRGIECGLAVNVQLLCWMWGALVCFYTILGIVDFAFQRHNTTKQLMMSLEEIKQEFKNSEGNPEIKNKRREVHREVQSGSLSANVAKSTVVVRNPVHVAVCLYYRPGETPLPEVLEIGHGKMALHIVAIADRAGVPVVENVRVARALASRIGVGQYIPSDLFEPVAHILRIAMKLRYDVDEDPDCMR
ncbi:EscU/YscU/HrcU family type III secretion system export apparatus switch protein [Burkholderia sp. Bp9126]|nr:EscU/YscU/HrcU family type III secretion system export apparatus switch protein [Burkholderia sp. Bp9126]